ncbi:MAG: RNA-binding S4 domain-containing protein [Rhodospirillales bacterium]
MGEPSLRLDKWLWFARFCRSRARAAALCESARLRVNRAIVRKAHQPVRVGDVLTFPQGAHIRVVAVKALAGRRGPASEARLLYDDLAPPRSPPAAAPPPPAAREPGAGRPTKAQRRAIDRLRGRA